MRLNTAEQHLAAIDPRWRQLILDTGPCRIKPDGREPWAALVESVVYQQLTGKAAATIYGRVTALFPDCLTPDLLAATPVETLRSCGLSAAKTKSILAIAQAAAVGDLPSRRAAQAMEDEALIARLLPLPGIGRWTIEMLLIFSLARPDVWPVDDFGVRQGWRLLFTLDEAPTPRALKAAGEAFSPYRSTAAWYLWRAVDRARAEQARATKGPLAIGQAD